MSVSQFDEQLFLQIETLVDDGDLEAGSAAYRAAQYAVESGYDSLSTPQREIYDAVVAPALAQLAARPCAHVEGFCFVARPA